MSLGTHRLSLFFAFTTFSINHESKNLLLYELYTFCCITLNNWPSFYFPCKLKSDYFLLDMNNLYFFKILPEFLVNCRIRRFIFSAYFMSINFGDRNNNKKKKLQPSPPLKENGCFLTFILISSGFMLSIHTLLSIWRKHAVVSVFEFLWSQSTLITMFVRLLHTYFDRPPTMTECIAYTTQLQTTE